MIHLIADSGIQFLTTEVNFNPSEPLLLSNNKLLRYYFCETTDIFSNEYLFDLLCENADGKSLLPVSELMQNVEALECNSNGREQFDVAGMAKVSATAETTFLTSYDTNDSAIYSINSLTNWMVRHPDTNELVDAFSLLTNRWLPMPMYMEEVDGVSGYGPNGWCRVRIVHIGPVGNKGMQHYRLIWAFDTQTSSDGLDTLRPVFPEGMGETLHFSLCNRADLLLSFLSVDGECSPICDYIASLLGVNTESPDHSRKYRAYYMYLINFLRLLPGATPRVDLHRHAAREIDVDLVLDIGNSRTCGILFEEGQFTKGKMLELRNLTQPWVTYENRTFDMRVVFRKADFGNDLAFDEEMFVWRSMVRIGEEARHLIYRSLEEDGLAQRTTNYSSPKRYLWDTKPYNGQWEYLTTEDDAFNQRQSEDIYVAGLSEQFDKAGNFVQDGSGVSSHVFSRASLMTFAFVEIYNHAIAQINSVKYRECWGNVDCRRQLRHIIVTCPTAMPLREQRKLRQCAEDAFKALCACTPYLQPATIFPTSDSLTPNPNDFEGKHRMWSYDEASCCQLVYLYAEIAQRYKGEIDKFFDMKGRLRPDIDDEKKTLTIGSVDIGAGTTDLMVCNYRYRAGGDGVVTPKPLFWDSFYLAGDDIVRALVQNIVIEGPDHDQPKQGHITGALTARLLSMTNEELCALPCINNGAVATAVYAQRVDLICHATDEADRAERIRHFAADLIHDFFGVDSSNNGYKERRCRLDFNTQISVPIAQFFMELLRTRRPARTYSYDDLFPDVKPASYLLDFFAQHFGFRFEELTWRYDPVQTADIVKATMEPLLKQMALVLYSQQCDIIVLAGRPTSLDVITELFIKHLPVSPDRLVRLNDYHVGNWFPTTTGEGYFYDQKAIVAVGGMVGHLAKCHSLPHLVIDFTDMIRDMKSTANYLGEYKGSRQQVVTTLLSPQQNTATVNVASFPLFIGQRQLDSPSYQARPLWALYNHSLRSPLRIILYREDYRSQPEELSVMEAMDSEGRSVKEQVELVAQTLVDDGECWLDKGVFELKIR